jgi:hypothetical protein
VSDLDCYLSRDLRFSDRIELPHKLERTSRLDLCGLDDLRRARQHSRHRRLEGASNERNQQLSGNMGCAECPLWRVPDSMLHRRDVASDRR